MSPMLLRFRAALLCGTALVIPLPAFAQTIAPNTAPVLDRVVAGGITVQQDATQTQVTQTQTRGIVDWRSFNVGQDHAVRFQQPSTSSITLNRVTTPDPSVIAGRVSANGQIAIVNQSGVVFTQGAQVEAAGLIVSSANITNENFLAGRIVFDRAGRPDARIENAGTITIREAGLAALVAPQVANRGTITARLGRVALAGAETHVVDLHGDGLLSIDVTGAVRQAPSNGLALVTNTGVIEAQGGSVQLTAHAADGIVQDLVRAGGRIAADTDAATGRTGRITIAGTGGAVRVEGEVRAVGTASGTRGGTIEVVADRVLLESGARVNASGAAGGGEVAVGTTLRGSANPRLAQRTGIAQGASVRADATERGRGGTVIVNSRDFTAHAGEISARGGPRGGDGGFVEVSGQGGLLVLGSIDVGAPAGAPGEILIDPVDLYILNDGDTLDTPFAQATISSAVDDWILAADAPPDNAYLWPSQFVNLQGLVRLEASNDIIVNASFFRSDALTLDAGRDIIINGGGAGIINLSGPFTLEAGRNLTIGREIFVADNFVMRAGTGNVTLNAPIDGGNDGGALAIDAGGSISINNLVRGFNGITLRAGFDGSAFTPGTGDVVIARLNADQVGRLEDSSGSGIAITAGNAIEIGGQGIRAGTLLSLASGPGGTSQTAPILAGVLEVTSSGDVTLDFVPGIEGQPNRIGTLGTSNVADNLFLRTDGLGDNGDPLVLQGAITVGGRFTLEPVTGVTQAASTPLDPHVVTAGELLIATPASITLAGDNAITTVAGLSSGGTIVLRNTTSLAIAGPVTAESGGSTIAIGINVEGGNLTIAAPVRAAADEGIALVSLNASGNLTVTADGSVTADGAQASIINLRAAAEFTSEGGAFTNTALPGGMTLAGNIVAEGGAVFLGAGTGGIVQTAGDILTSEFELLSGGDALLASSGNAIARLRALSAAGDVIIDNGTTDLDILTGPPVEGSPGTGATIAFRTAGTVTLVEGAELLAPGAGGRIAFRVGDLEIQGGASITASTVEIAPFNPTRTVLPVDTILGGTDFAILTSDLAAITADTLRIGATTFAGTTTTTADGIEIVGPLAFTGTLDLRSLAGITQQQGADLTLGTLTGVAGGAVVLTNPGNTLGALADFTAGGGFALQVGGPELLVPEGRVVTAGGALVIDVLRGALTIDGTVTGSETQLFAATALTVNGFSAIARDGDLTLGADSVTLNGLAAAGGDILIFAANSAFLSGTAQTPNTLFISSPLVTFGGLDARGADVVLSLGLTGTAGGILDARGLLVQGGSGVRLSGSIAGVTDFFAAALGRRATADGVLLTDPPPAALDFTFNDCPIGVALCFPPPLVVPVAENPLAVIAELDPLNLVPAADRLRPPATELRFAGGRDRSEEGDLAPPDVRGGDY